MNLSKRAGLLGTREVREWAISDVELRADEGSDEWTFRGEASVVENPYTVYDMFGEFSETIREGAFDKTLSESPDVVFLVNHRGLPLARTARKDKPGTMTLSADPNLSVEARLSKSDPDVAQIQPKIDRGDLDEMSFAFRVTRQEWNEDYTERSVLEVNIDRGDVSVVTFGANPATNAALRSIDIETCELDAALAALREGNASDGQWALVDRATRAMTELLSVKSAEVPHTINEDLARLYALDPRAA